ncbi:hypothetical protein JXL21_13685 [Candidatus Bathyarchaeota archaeon]|nr:hypothetical protein [Candidatus Bathyarchaeota archaeon]
MRQVWIHVLTALAVLGVGATSYHLMALTSMTATQVNSYEMDDGPYMGGRLTAVESLTTSTTEIRVMYSANATVDVYIMTRGDYNRLDSLGARPEQYLATQQGVNGTLTYRPTNSNKVYMVAFYSDDAFMLHERQISALYYRTSEADIRTMWMLDGALIVIALALAAWSVADSLGFMKGED